MSGTGKSLVYLLVQAYMADDVVIARGVTVAVIVAGSTMSTINGKAPALIVKQKQCLSSLTN